MLLPFVPVLIEFTNVPLNALAIALLMVFGYLYLCCFGFCTRRPAGKLGACEGGGSPARPDAAAASATPESQPLCSRTEDADDEQADTTSTPSDKAQDLPYLYNPDGAGGVHITGKRNLSGQYTEDQPVSLRFTPFHARLDEEIKQEEAARQKLEMGRRPLAGIQLRTASAAPAERLSLPPRMFRGHIG